uniref:COS2.1 n=1 Tax=Ciona intestinalis TaxID=7719 RepID=Q94431_CIOIN
LSGANLTISLLKLSDAGSYTCNVIAVGSPQESGTTVLIVTVPPVAHIALLGNQLTCNVEGNPRPSLKWFLPTGEVLRNSPSVYVTPTSSGNGRYVCMATNPPESRNLHISSEPSHGVVKEGEDLQLHCSTSSNPISQYDWYFQGTKIGTGSSFRIQNLQRHQAGTYQCVAYNYVPGSANGDVAVMVEYPPSNVIVTQNENELSCVAGSGSIPEPMYKWILPNGTETAGNKSVLFLSPSSAGQYTCSVSNIHGRENATFIYTTGKTHLKKLYSRVGGDGTHFLSIFSSHLVVNKEHSKNYKTVSSQLP